jgi:hypothetical protein
MKYLLLATLAVVAVCVALYYLVLKPKHIQPWTGDQLARSMDMLRALSKGNLSDDVLKCFVHELSVTLSFKDFVAKSDDDKNKLLQKISPKCPLPDTGMKGKWNDVVKKNLMDLLMTQKHLDAPCALCVVGTLEQNFEPKDITSKLDLVIADVIEKCAEVCHNMPPVEPGPVIIHQ